MRFLTLSLLAAGTALPLVPARVAPPPPRADFTRDVRPFLAARCLECHGPAKQKGGLRLDLRDAVLRAKDDILQRVVGDEGRMPPKGPRLTAKQVDALRAWIDQGAAMPGQD